MEDETINLHLSTIKDTMARIEETTMTGFGDVRASQTATDIKIAKIETKVGGLTEQIAQIKKNPFISMGVGGAGAGGIIASILYYLKSGAPPS